MSLPSVRWIPAAHTQTVGSARLRCYRPAVALAAAGWNSRVVKRSHLLGADIVVFQKAYSERHLDLARRLRRRGTTIVLDLCDNHFYNPSGDERLAVRARRMTEMIGFAHLVTVSTPDLAALIEHPEVRIVDDALEVIAPVRGASIGPGRHVVWFGNAGSEQEGFGLGDLRSILPDLTPLARQFALDLTVVSNSREQFDRLISGSAVNARYEEWTPEAVHRVLCVADLAVLPVATNPFTRCKSPNRVITALQYGLATVAGRVPSYEEFASFLRFDDWGENVANYLSDAALRGRDVAQGQAYIGRRFPIGHLERQWAEVLRAARDLR